MYKGEVYAWYCTGNFNQRVRVRRLHAASIVLITAGRGNHLLMRFLGEMNLISGGL